MPASDLCIVVAWHHDTPVATLIATPITGPTSWIRGAAIEFISPVHHHTVIQAMLQRLHEHLPGKHWYFTADIYDTWLRDFLVTLGFRIDIHIIALECRIRPVAIPVSDDSFQLRPMQSDDITSILTIDASAFTHEWHKSLFEVNDMWQSPGIALVATATDVIIGYAIAIWHHRANALHLVRIAVLPTWRRHGVARHLLATVIDYAHHNDAQYLTLNTQQTNTAAIALYQQFGFHPTGERYPVYHSPASPPS
jgi:ribosomal-protein-alanine N-acetyltransferase